MFVKKSNFLSEYNHRSSIIFNYVIPTFEKIKYPIKYLFKPLIYVDNFSFLSQSLIV